MRVLFALGFSPLAAFGQATFGTITGAVSDSTGAVVPNVKVEVTNEGTGIARTVETDGAANYVAPNLNAGTYRVEFNCHTEDDACPTTAQAAASLSFLLIALGMILRVDIGFRDARGRT